MADTRLIERWLPISALGIESLRERTPMTPFPAPNRLHVWWARRPLVASRAAVLASLLPADADREKFLRVIGIHGDPVAAKSRIAKANRTGERLGADAYGYGRAFSYTPNDEEREWLAARKSNGATVVLDPTAGGGSIPLEALRLGLPAYANDLNPVAALIQRATVEWPGAYEASLQDTFEDIGKRLVDEVRQRLAGVFPEEPGKDTRPDGYLWARTVTCPYCEGLVPLSPNWRLAPDGTGVRLLPACGDGPGSAGRVCGFEIVKTAAKQSGGTVARGDGTCPYPDCERVIDGDDIKRQAQAGGMGEQLYTVVYKRRVKTKTKSGKRGRDKWVRGYRAPRPEDDNSAEIDARLAEKLPEWEAFDIVPSEDYDDMYADRSKIYGVNKWRDLFSRRQLLCHGTSVEVYREMLDADEAARRLDDVGRAAYGYLALALDTMLDYNNRASYWDNGTGRGLRHLFNRHDFAFIWSYGEMAPLLNDVGYEWAIKKTAKCIEELVAMVRPDINGGAGERGELLKAMDPDVTESRSVERVEPPLVIITCKSADNLDHLDDGSMDVVVMDPPYYDNVMYAELSDFFYVWLKRTAGRVFPELFRRKLTDKENEAVANPARFAGEKGAQALAGREYHQRMAGIFAECRRVLKVDGIMTLMFTHKATGAWDALTSGLMDAGFVITASWPINTESEGGLHIKNKAAAKSTIFLACRPRGSEAASDASVRSGEDSAEAVHEASPAYGDDSAPVYWEHVEPQVARAVRARVEEFQAAGIGGVDLYLASFGPALEEFSRHWPLRRGRPRAKPEERRRRRQQALIEEAWDPYAVTPEDALDAARREVKRWRLGQLTSVKTQDDLDPATAFFVLAWDTFKAPVFAYDEALRLGRAVGVDLDAAVVGRIAGKKGSDLQLWDSAQRAAAGALGPADGSRGMIDALHHAAHAARGQATAAARELLERAGIHRDPRFVAALEAVLEVLPPSSTHTGIKLEGALEASASDFDALYSLYRLAYTEQIDEPDQLRLWREQG